MEGVDGVLIATPAATHARIALPYARAGVPTFIEKPMAASLKEAEVLAAAATSSGALVQVGHVHLHNPAYLKLKELRSRVGEVRWLSFEGMNRGPVRDDVSVLWDWGPHGVSMALDLLGQLPEAVQAWGTRVLRPRTRLYDTVHLRLLFARNVEMVCALSWMAPEKRVRFTVAGTDGTLVFDDTADRKVALHAAGRVHYPRYSRQPPLTRELLAFIRAIKTKRQTSGGAGEGLAVVRVLAAAERSLVLDGRRVRL